MLHINLVFYKEMMEHRVTDKYLETRGAEIVGYRQRDFYGIRNSIPLRARSMNIS
jgi:hypothetical protein